MFNFVYSEIDFAHKLDRASSPTEDYSKHLHYFYEILYFVQGDVKYTVESETRKLCEGDLVLISPGKYHFATVNSKVAYERYVLKFPATLLPEYLYKSLASRDAFFGNVKKYSLIFDGMDSSFGKYTDQELHTLFMCDTIKLLIMLCQQPTHSENQVNSFISALINYIDENIRNPITLDILSAQFNFSKSYISTEFKKYMKIPIIQYIRAKKIIAAHQMIMAGEKKSVAAEMFGFKDYSTFYRSYLKFMGAAPTEIAQEHKQ